MNDDNKIRTAMTGKYSNLLQFWFARFYRELHRMAVYWLLYAWKPVQKAEEGYTLIVGVIPSLIPVLYANLNFLQKQELNNLKRLILVFNCLRSQAESSIEQTLRQRYPNLPFHFVYYNLPQWMALNINNNFPWLHCWLSWSLGISETYTRHAMLHDVDALLITPDFIESRYREIRNRGVQYLCSRYYDAANGLRMEDKMLHTLELFFDAQFIKEVFRPADLLNRVYMLNGRNVDFDIFHYAQFKNGTTSLMPFTENKDLIHPSQMVSQYVMLVNNNKKMPIRVNNILLLPYYYYLGGDSQLMENLIEQMKLSGGKRVRLSGKYYNISVLDKTHVEWMKQQISILENLSVGQVRPLVKEYLDLIEGALNT